uniref:Uncharacterized protein n=1 Tax=Tanacetum cinerariifolium TaxID=118510 RepID=A0A6L2L8W5_TANCI|nr:hypothetical protein [Tanacetum cinerariifolium]
MTLYHEHTESNDEEEETQGNQVKDGAQATHKTEEATTSTTVVPDTEPLSFHQRIINLEKDVKELKIVDHSSTLLSTIKSEVPKAIKEYLGTSLDNSLQKVTDAIKKEQNPSKTGQNRAQNGKRRKVNSQKSKKVKPDKVEAKEIKKSRKIKKRDQKLPFSKVLYKERVEIDKC